MVDDRDVPNDSAQDDAVARGCGGCLLAALVVVVVGILGIGLVSLVGMDDSPSKPAVDQIVPTLSGSPNPDPVSDPGGYAEWFCRSTVRSDGLEQMAADLGTTPTPEAIARAYALGVSDPTRPEAEAGCLSGLEGV